MQVNVVHCKKYKGGDDHYVGRPTPLGNPFTVKEHGHGVCIEMYKNWLNLQYSTNNQVVIRELMTLARVLRDTGTITLSCWCAPNPCHADVIGKAITNLVNKGLVPMGY